MLVGVTYEVLCRQHRAYLGLDEVRHSKRSNYDLVLAEHRRIVCCMVLSLWVAARKKPEGAASWGVDDRAEPSVYSCLSLHIPSELSLAFLLMLN